MTVYNPSSEAQFLVSFSKFATLLFTEKTGGDWEAESSEYSNGSGMEIHNLIGPRKVTPINLKAPWDPAIQAQLDPVLLSWECTPGTIIIKPVNCQGVPGTNPDQTINDLEIAGVTAFNAGDAYVYTGCKLKKYVTPKVDRKSANAAMIELEFVVDSFHRQGGGTYVPAVGRSSSNTDVIKSIQDLLKQSPVA